MQPTPGLEEIIQHRALEESNRYYGDGPTPARNPLQIIMDQEEEAAQDQNLKERRQQQADLLRAQFAFYMDAVPLRIATASWKRIQVRIPEGYTVRYEKESPLMSSFVQFLNQAGEVVKQWQPARLKSTYKRREAKGEKGESAEIQILKHTIVSAKRTTGERILGEAESLGLHYDLDPDKTGMAFIAAAYEAGNQTIKELGGAGVAKEIGVTRQAMSLRFKGMDEKVREATGGKSGARGLRHKANPNKGKTKEQIQIQTNPKP